MPARNDNRGRHTGTERGARARPDRNAYTGAGVSRNDQERRAARMRHRRMAARGHAARPQPHRDRGVAVPAQDGGDGSTTGQSSSLGLQNRPNGQISGQSSSLGFHNHTNIQGHPAHANGNPNFNPQLTSTTSDISIPLRPPNPTPAPPLPTRMLNTKTPPPRPERPVNPYRGKDPIKRLVQNDKLRALLAGKPMPRQRKKAAMDRPDLRQGMGRVMK